MALTTEKLSRDQFASLAPEWNKLLESTRANNPFLRWEWIESWRHAFEGQCKHYLLGVRDGNVWIAFAPFAVRRAETRPGFRILEFCGTTELYPDYMDIIAAPEHEREAVDNLCNFLRNNKQDWDFISFDNLLPDSVLLTHAPAACPDWNTELRQTSACPVLDMDGTMEQFLGGHFRKKKRYNLKRQVRLLLEEQGCIVVKETDPARLDAALKDFLELHDRRAAAKKINSSIKGEQVRTFLRTVSRRFLDAGLLELWFLRKDGAPVSALYGFGLADRLYYYQSGVDPDWDRWSAGTVLLTKVIEYAFQEKFAVFDFLKGDEEYKQTWFTRVQPEYRLRLYRKDARGTLIYGGHRFISFCREVRNKLTGK